MITYEISKVFLSIQILKLTLDWKYSFCRSSEPGFIGNVPPLFTHTHFHKTPEKWKSQGDES